MRKVGGCKVVGSLILHVFQVRTYLDDSTLAKIKKHKNLQLFLLLNVFSLYQKPVLDRNVFLTVLWLEMVENAF